MSPLEKKALLYCLAKLQSVEPHKVYAKICTVTSNLPTDDCNVILATLSDANTEHIKKPINDAVEWLQSVLNNA